MILFPPLGEVRGVKGGEEGGEMERGNSRREEREEITDHLLLEM